MRRGTECPCVIIPIQSCSPETRPKSVQNSAAASQRRVTAQVCRNLQAGVKPCSESAIGCREVVYVRTADSRQRTAGERGALVRCPLSVVRCPAKHYIITRSR